VKGLLIYLVKLTKRPVSVLVEFSQINQTYIRITLTTDGKTLATMDVSDCSPEQTA
jgi:hypothetical protein